MTPMDPDEHWRGGNDSAVDRREQLLAEAVSVYGDILAREEEVDVADFCARYPDIQNELKALLETMVILQDILGDTVMSDSADGYQPARPFVGLPNLGSDRLRGHGSGPVGP